MTFGHAIRIAVCVAALWPAGDRTWAAKPTRRDVQAAEHARAVQLEAARAAAARAAAAAAQEAQLGSQRAAAAAALRAAEEATADAASRVAALDKRRRLAAAHLAVRAAELRPLIPLIVRLSLYPTETLLAAPQSSEQAIRGVLVLGGIGRQLEQAAAALRAEQRDVDDLQAQVDAAMPALRAAEQTQQVQEAALDDQIAATREARHAAEDAGAAAIRQAAIEASRAETLRAAIARIEADEAAAAEQAERDAQLAERQHHDAQALADHQRQAALTAPAGPGVGAARGALASPVAGIVQRAFGEPTDAGPATGITYDAAPGARVVSPCGGRVVFAGPFRSFGLLLIVDCGAGTHFVLSGFERLDAQVGQSVQAAEPVGVMPGWEPGSSQDRPTLYLELRQNGQPVNPAPYLRAKG